MKLQSFLVIVMVLAILVSTCSCTQQPIVTTQTVEIPVVRPCPKPLPQRPSWAMDSVSKGDRFFDKGRAAFQELLQRKAYETKLESWAADCASNSIGASRPLETPR